MCDYKKISEGSSASLKTAMMRSVVCDTLNWIEANLQNDLHIDQLAGRAGYTRWHFQRAFKKITGHSLSEYIRIRRIVKASEAIIHTRERMMDIAYDTGYSNQQLMSRLIRATFGMSPTELRNCASVGPCAQTIAREVEALRQSVLLTN